MQARAKEDGMAERHWVCATRDTVDEMVWVNLSNATLMERRANFTAIFFPGVEDTVSVRETPEQLMAMAREPSTRAP
jgi:hypothetical protein